MKEIRSLRVKIEQKETEIKKLVNEALTTNETSDIYWSKMKSRAKALYKELNAIFKDNMPEIIKKDFYKAIENQIEKLKSIKGIVNYKARYNKLQKEKVNDFVFSNRNKNTIKILNDTTTANYELAVNNGIKTFNLFARQTQQKLIQEKELQKFIAEAEQEGASIPAIKNRIKLELLDKLKEGKILTITNKNGKQMHYDAGQYAELIARTQSREAQSMAVLNTALQFESDLVQVSMHNTDCPECQEYEGKIFSISGKSKNFPVADAYPPFHPRCQHSIFVVFEEILEATDELQEYIDFSNGDSDRPPNAPSFIPVKDRKEDK